MPARQVGRLLALKDASDVDGRLTVLVEHFRRIGHQATAGDDEARGVCTSMMNRGFWLMEVNQVACSPLSKIIFTATRQ